MKKLVLLLLSGLTVFALAACGDKSADSGTAKEKPKVDTENINEETTAQTASSIEPTEEHKCAFCDMKIYLKDETMGVFTAQALNSKGENLFFDDSGCLLNYERKTGEKLDEKWVRDYLSADWIDAEKAIPVHSDMQTPMKYGYAFFETQDSADKFTSEKTDMEATLSSWEEIDKVSNERYIKKMEKMKNKEEDDHNEHDDESENSH
ncbi:nitrous oxide reductase accessory protein NosL [Bacillus sp. FJAT-49705]|uniref:Nitrous oxide reductase accessory protein NosL n=1 Tax=Cytobacillus citreus TaxID=2833586 RepID=A0ABS5NWH6_9BACI|nr:nitrous oxide reductase accessory protein NosL [Cytobacillus citreus]MBS4192177.1 nitrous oxide reductase accessory protein NosL [Cytobacillus citreus]